MSKFIRTKDGRIIAFGEKYAYPTRCSNGKTYFSFKELTEDRFEVMKEYNHWEIQNQSENLEKLCDEFVVIGYYKNKPLHFDTLEEAQRFVYDNGCQNKDYIEIKSAIWTSKGLIYVAKMNDKGELVLI